MLRVTSLLMEMFPGDEKRGWPRFSDEILATAGPNDMALLRKVDHLIFLSGFGESNGSVELLLEDLKQADARLMRSFCELSLFLYFGANQGLFD